MNMHFIENMRQIHVKSQFTFIMLRSNYLIGIHAIPNILRVHPHDYISGSMFSIPKMDDEFR